MGFLGTALGLGEHGSATIVLDREGFFAGDVITGRVLLSVTSRIDRADPIRMTIIGRETLAYDEEQAHEVTAEQHDSSESTKNLKHEKLEYTILSDEIVVDVPARSYDPAVYEFLFEYRLPRRGLVPSFKFKASRVGNLSNVRAEAAYELHVRVPVDGMFKADLIATCQPVIREDPSLKAPCSLTQTKTVPVYYCVFWCKGSCEVTATLRQNVVPLGGQAYVDILVANDSARHIDRLTTALNQIVTLNETKYERDGLRRASKTIQIGFKTGGGVAPGEKLSASLSHPITRKKPTSELLIPTMRSHFLTFDYELTLQCHQAWCWEDPRVTFPIVLTTKTAGSVD